MLEVAEERGDLVDGAGSGVVGAAAGVETAVTQHAEFAFGGGIAARGNVVMLPGTVDTASDVPEGDFRLIPHADHA